MKLTIWGFCLPITIAGLMLFSLACQQQVQQQVPDTRAADEQTLRDIEAQWSKAIAAKDVERIVAGFAEDATVCWPDEPIVTGKEAIRAGLTKNFAKQLTYDGQVLKVEVSRSGDLAVTHGTYVSSMTGLKGRPISDKGKWVTVYRKQADGNWKAFLDISNSDLPAPPQ